MRRVLIVDDDQGTRETLGISLRHAGYDVHLADSGASAINTLSQRMGIDALLLDLRLGDMSGYEVLRWMRDQSAVVPTAVMTAFRSAFDPDEAIALGAVAYVDRPLSIDDALVLTHTLTAPPSALDDPRRLHARVLAGQPGALDCLATVFLQVIPQRLGRAFPRVPWDFKLDATTDACLEYAANPARFDPSRSASILDFVFLIARRNLINRVRAEGALKSREARYTGEQAVLFPPVLQLRSSDVDVRAAISAVTVDPKERRAAELWLEDAGNDAIAEALGMGHLGLSDRRREAKRFKDRLLKRLSRYFRPLPGA